MERVEAAIVGGGVIGLAVARALHYSGVRCLVLEKNAKCGLETSSRNSEVIHSGIYYPPKSLKSRHCIEGRQLLLEYVKEKNIKYNLCGKLIIAQENEFEALERIYRNGLAVGLSELKLLTPSQISKMEPDIVSAHAIYVPYTGILDSQSFVESLEFDITSQGFSTFEPSMVVENCEFQEASLHNDSLGTNHSFWKILTSRGPIQAKFLINCAGLAAAKVAEKISPLSRATIPNMLFAKGCYFRLSGQSNIPFKHLIYPIPVKGGLGIHATIDWQGAVKFGPNVEWMNEVDVMNPDYSVDDNQCDSFTNAISKFWPSIRNFRLVPDYCGIRPKLSKGWADFSIQTEKNHGLRTLINLYGIESPGLTSSLSLGKLVAEEVIKIKSRI